MVVTFIVTLIAHLAPDPPVAPPEPPPIPLTPSPTSRGDDRDLPGQPRAAAVTTPTGGQSSADPATPPNATIPPRRVWVILDYYKEFGGTVIREDEATMLLRTPSGEERTVDRNAIVSAVALLDYPEGTPVVVRWRSGRSLPGELVSDGFEEIVVRLNGVRTSLPRRQIHCIERETPFEEQLARFRARLPADAWDVRLELVQWLLARQHPEIAIEELKEIRKHADSEDAARLLIRAEAELALQRKAPNRDDSKRRAVREPTRTGQPRISDDDVNLIRVMEVNSKAPPRMHHMKELPSAILERYSSDERMPANREQIADWSTPRLLQLLFTLKARELYGMVRVDEDPEHLRVFRKRVHDGWLIPNCATSRCHGGPAGGKLVFATEDSKSPRTAYTNLLVLLAHRTEQGHALLDFDSPEGSTLTGFGRPRTETKVPHPPVAGWKPVSASLQRSIEDEATAWIGGMHRPRHQYPVALPEPAEDSGAPEEHGPR